MSMSMIEANLLKMVSVKFYVCVDEIILMVCMVLVCHFSSQNPVTSITVEVNFRV